MSGVAIGVGSGIVGAAVIGGVVQYNAAKKAAAAQTRAAKGAVAEQRRQFDAMQALMAPYVAAGGQSLAELQALTGQAGPAEQEAALRAIQASPEFTAMVQQGENALLQSASATGGLRGGNTQAALATFRPALLADEINKRYSRLFAMTQLGQASAAGTGAAGIQTGQGISAQLGNIGAAQAGAVLGQAQAINQILGVGQQLGASYLGSRWG